MEGMQVVIGAAGSTLTHIHRDAHPLISAIVKEQIPTALKWISAAKGLWINVKDHLGISPLLLAISKGQNDIVKELIIAGADIQVIDSEGFNVLHYAAKQHDSTIIKLLLDKINKNDPLVNMIAMNLQSPILIACQMYEPNFASHTQLLIDHGANIINGYQFGKSLLHEACERGNIDIAKVLIDKGIPIEAINNKGETALYCTCLNISKKYFQNVVVFLLNKGADENKYTNIAGSNRPVDLIVAEGLYVRRRSGEPIVLCKLGEFQ